jgi:hypothetical protein
VLVVLVVVVSVLVTFANSTPMVIAAAAMKAMTATKPRPNFAGFVRLKAPLKCRYKERNLNFPK